MSTSIEWTDHTFNPWQGCVRVSPGCANCYAAALDGGAHWGRGARRRPASERQWAEPLAWNRAARSGRARVFCASMADVFEDRRDLDPYRERLWSLIGATIDLDWLLLTKRPENILRLIPATWSRKAPRNVWYGVSVESPAFYHRVDALRAVPATVRFISVEPMLEACPCLPLDGIQWVIFGGESGRDARPCSMEWIRSGVAQAIHAGVAPFVKQTGSVYARNGKGSDLEDLPPDLRVRNFPREDAGQEIVNDMVAMMSGGAS